MDYKKFKNFSTAEKIGDVIEAIENSDIFKEYDKADVIYALQRLAEELKK